MGLSATVTHAKSITVADWAGAVTVGNSSGGTTTVQASDLGRPSDWNSAHSVALSLDLKGTDMATIGFFEPFVMPNTGTTTSTLAGGSWYLFPFDLPGEFNSGIAKDFWANAAGFKNGTTFSATSTGSMSKVQTIWDMLALYTRGTGASTSRLESVWSSAASWLFTWTISVSGSASTAVSITNALTVSFPGSFDISGGVTYSSTAQSGTTSTGVSTAASTFADNLITGAVAYASGSMQNVFGVASDLGMGDYWLAHAYNSSSSSSGTRYTAGTMQSTHSFLGIADYSLMNNWKNIGASVSNTSSAPPSFEGFYATSSSVPPTAIATSDMRYTTGRLYVFFNKVNEY